MLPKYLLWGKLGVGRNFSQHIPTQLKCKLRTVKNSKKFERIYHFIQIKGENKIYIYRTLSTNAETIQTSSF